MSKKVAKFNRLLSMFINDLSASVPTSSCLASAQEWLTALQEVDPSNAKVLTVFMDALQGANDFIVKKDPDVFKHLNILPSVLKPDELWMIFSHLDENDKATCWKYLSKLYKEGVTACKELGIELDTSASAAAGDAALQLLLKNTPQSGDLEAMQVPDGPIVLSALGALCTQYCDLIENWGVLSCDELKTLRSMTAEQFASEIEQRYPSDVVQCILTNVAGVVDQYGVPFVDEPLGDCAQREEILAAVMQMSTICLTLRSVDSTTIDAVEDVARRFMKLVQNGEVDLSNVGDDPFQLLQTLTSSGVADDLMAMLAAQS
ncbi:hypothetical protein JKP88DRAFT_243984 [Tribonema minus]|uniref:Uncharacterized protein n=1 Tax=Tribonema minus TaxID=303371 RepID=A0A835Z7M8_9STRA|nr:hypothetical protein JKP88DRAFT_243984 [Tribonema minus]